MAHSVKSGDREDLRNLGAGRRSFIRAGGLMLAGAVSNALLPWQSLARVRTGEGPPKTVLTDLKGNRFTLPSDFKGKVLLIHFWASWCPYCVKEIGTLESLYKAYKDKGMVPCSVNVGESREAAASYIAGLNVSYPVLLDPDSSVARQYGVTGIPTTYIVNKGGIVEYRIIGEVNRAGLEKIVGRLL